MNKRRRFKQKARRRVSKAKEACKTGRHTWRLGGLPRNPADYKPGLLTCAYCQATKRFSVTEPL